MIVAIVYYVRHHKKKEDGILLIFFEKLIFALFVPNFFLRLTTGLTIAMLIGDFYHVLKPAWISFTVLSLVHPFVNESRKKLYIELSELLLAAFYILYCLNGLSAPCILCSSS